MLHRRQRGDDETSDQFWRKPERDGHGKVDAFGKHLNIRFNIQTRVLSKIVGRELRVKQNSWDREGLWTLREVPKFFKIKNSKIFNKNAYIKPKVRIILSKK